MDNGQDWSISADPFNHLTNTNTSTHANANTNTNTNTDHLTNTNTNTMDGRNINGQSVWLNHMLVCCYKC